MTTGIKFLGALALLSVSLYAADTVLFQNGSLVQKNQQNLVAPIKAVDNGDGTWTIAVNTTTATAVVTPMITTATGNGSVASGSRGVTFVFSNDFIGTILGATFAGNADSSFRVVPSTGATLTAIAYTVSAGNVRILDVR